MLIPMPLAISLADVVEYNNWGEAEVERVFEPDGYAYTNNSPTVGTPFYIELDFQEAIALAYWNMTSYGSSYDLPEDLEIWGSATGAFAGEETVLFSGVDLPIVQASNEVRVHEISAPQDFRYYRLNITEWTESSKYLGPMILNTVIPNAFDTVADYIEPLNKIVNENWVYCMRDAEYGEMVPRFLSTACLFAEDLGWDIVHTEFPLKLVIKSDGLNHDQPPVWVVVELYSSNTWKFEEVYGYWDDETKTGSFPMGQNSTPTYSNVEVGSSDSQVICCHGNRDMFSMIAPNNVTSNYDRWCTFLGHLPQNSTILPVHTTLTAPQIAATDVTIEVASSAGFEVGNFYIMWGIDGEGQDFGVQCTAIVDGTHITIDSLPRDYAAGAFIGHYPNKFFRQSSEWCNFGQGKISGLTAPTYSEDFTVSGALDGAGSPSGIHGKYILGQYMVKADIAQDGIVALLDHVLYSPVATYDMQVFLVGIKAPRDVGAVTSAATKTMTDTAKAWTVNEHAGRYVYISAGSGYSDREGNFMEILSNTADTLTVRYEWILPLSAADTYQIADEVWQQGQKYDYQIFKCGVKA
jgi:hypothetical protein